METDDKSNGLLPLLRRMASLGIESVKLTTAERLTVLCSAISIIAMLAMVLGFVLLFFSLGCVKMLSQSMSEFWAYVIVGGVYVVAGAIIIVARRVLVVDPIARFMSRLILGNNYKPSIDNNEDEIK